MPGFLLHVGATVLCAHGGQAQPTAPNARVLVSGQPTITMPAPYARGRLCLQRQRRALTVRDRDLDDRGDARDVERPAAAAARQPGRVRAERHAVGDRGDPDEGDGDMNIDFPFHRRQPAADGRHHRRRSRARPDRAAAAAPVPASASTGRTSASGLQQLVFAGNSPELAATLQFMVQGSLQQYLSDLIEVNAVQVDAIESALQVRVDYVVRRTQQRQTTSITTGDLS